jgi:hypothetical protein
MRMHRMMALPSANLMGRSTRPRHAARSDRAMTRRSRKGGNRSGKDGTWGNRRDGAMRCNEDRNLWKAWILKSATQPLISYGAGHALEIQIVKNPYIKKAWFACCVVSHVPSR